VIKTMLVGKTPTAPSMPGTERLVCMDMYMVFFPADAGFMAPLPWTCDIRSSESKRKAVSKFCKSWEVLTDLGYECETIEIKAKKE